MLTTSYTQHSSGDFSVDVIPGTPHCGIDANRANLRYMVDLTFTLNPLDHNGFLFDNTDFQYYFQHIPPVDYSCEVLAQRSAEHFMADSRVQSAVVRIYPFADTYVSASVVRTTDITDL